MRKILIVDDAKINRMILNEILKDSYEVLEASDGLEAADICRRYTNAISAVLLDVVMPFCSGLDFLREGVREGWLDHVPVIVISTDSDEYIVNQALQCGAAGFIKRPVDRRVIRKELGRYDTEGILCKCRRGL